MKRFFILALLVGLIQPSFSQQMVVHTHSQGRVEFGLGDIDSITFSGHLIPSDSLMAYYPFNGNARDTSGNGHHGTVTNATLVPDRFGNPAGAYSFNGSSSLINIGQVHPPVNSASISFWQKGDSGNVTEKWVLGDAYQHRGLGFPKYFADSVSFEIQKSSGSQRRRVSAFLSSVDRAQWTHIVGVSNNGTLSIYKNGVLQESVAGFLGDQGTYDFIFGRSHAGFAWRGYLDDIRIYARALTPGEIQALYHESGTQ